MTKAEYLKSIGYTAKEYLKEDLEHNTLNAIIQDFKEMLKYEE